MSDFVKVANKDEVKEGEMKIVDAEGEQVVLVRVKDKLHAFTNTCTHESGPLGEGALNDNVVTCPWHQAQFDVTTGKVLGLPAEKDMDTFEVKEEGNDILVKI